MMNAGLKILDGRLGGSLLIFSSLVNFAASLAMALVLAPATMAGGAPDVRMHYIDAHRGSVQLGWSLWIGASLSLLLFFFVLDQVMKERQARTRPMFLFALILAVVGAASDTLADLVALGMLPELAGEFVRMSAGFGPNSAMSAANPSATAAATISIIQRDFLLWDRFMVLCTGGLGNGCYGLAGCLVTIGLWKERAFSFPARIIAIPLWILTFYMTYGSFRLDGNILPVAVGGTMATFVAWSFLLGVELILGRNIFSMVSSATSAPGRESKKR